MQHSVTESTHKNYRNGWMKWQAFAQMCDESPFPLKTEPMVLFDGIWAPRLVALTLKFCTYSSECHNIKASTLGAYLAGIRHFLLLNLHSTEFLDHAAIGLLKAGISHTQRYRDTKSKGKLPFVAEMIEKLHTRFRDAPKTSGSFGILTAIRLAYSCLLRRSEYIPSVRGKHWLRSQDVSFVLNDGSIIESQHLLPSHIPLVTKVLIFLRSSKTDQKAKGYTFVLYVMEGDDTDTGLTMAYWAAFNRLQYDKPFFASFSGLNNKQWCITATRVQDVLREIAHQCGFSPSEVLRFTTHSLRYGGASTLNEAKMPKRKIKFAGRWKSDAFELYCQHSHKLFLSTQNILRDSNILNVEKVKETSRARR